MYGNKKNKTPSLANWLVSRFIKEGLHEEFFGDLEEVYRDRVAKKGKFYAWLVYWVDAIHLLMGFSSPYLFRNNTAMYKHYLIVANRNLLRNKAYSAINIFGLALAMGVCILICQYLYFELSFDRSHADFRDTYRIILDRSQNGAYEGANPYMAHSLGPRAKEEIPEITAYIRLYTSDNDVLVSDSDTDKQYKVQGPNMYFVDSTFLSVFDFPLTQGEKESIFDDKFNVVITEKTSKKYFGSNDPMGKILNIIGGASAGSYTVSGVLQDLPSNGHLQFDMLFPMENYLEFGHMGVIKRYNHLPLFATYISIDKSADPGSVGKKLNSLITKYKGEWNPEVHIEEKARLQPIAEIHLKSENYIKSDFVANKGNFQDIKIFGVIALLILIIAWVNYVNLSTARSMHRAKEVGVRKSIGAFRRQLMVQFMMESVLINLIAAILAIGIAFLTLPLLNGIIGKSLVLSLFGVSTFWIWFLGVIFSGSLLSGLYPAFVLSSFRPIGMLSAKSNSGAGSFNLRKGLIVFQFLSSLLLISGTYLVYKQITFMKGQELGIDMDKILVLDGPKQIKASGAPQLTSYEELGEFNTYSRSVFEAFRQEVTRHSSIVSVTGSRVIPGQVNKTQATNIRKWDEPASSGKSGMTFYVGRDFISTYGLELLAGEPFGKDLADEEFVVINEEAVLSYGLGSPQEAINKKLSIGEKPRTIVGVIKNFHWQSLKEANSPMVLWFVGATPKYFSIKMDVSDIQGSLAHIKSVYDTFYPGNAFLHSFADREFNNQYNSDVRFGNLFLVFTILSILIACIGLLALVSYSATLRLKEIGIRKVLGASTTNLMLLLSKEYLVLLSISFVLAIPIILYWGRAWLENYASRIGLGVELLLVPGLIITCICVLTVGRRTYSAATSNPIESLKVD